MIEPTEFFSEQLLKMFQLAILMSTRICTTSFDFDFPVTFEFRVTIGYPTLVSNIGVQRTIL